MNINIGSIYKYKDSNGNQQYWCCTDILRKEDNTFTFGGITTEREFPLIDDIDRIDTSFPMPFYYDVKKKGMQRLFSDLINAIPDGSIFEDELVEQYILVKHAGNVIRSILSDLSAMKFFNKGNPEDQYEYKDGFEFHILKPGRIYNINYTDYNELESRVPKSSTFIMLMPKDKQECYVANITEINNLERGETTYISGATFDVDRYGRYQDKSKPQLEIGIIHPKMYAKLLSESLVMYSSFYNDFDKYIIKDVRKLVKDYGKMKEYIDNYMENKYKNNNSINN